MDNIDRWEQYNGVNCNIRTRHLTSEELFRAHCWAAQCFGLSLRGILSNRFLRWHFWPFLTIGMRTLLRNLGFLFLPRLVRKPELDL